MPSPLSFLRSGPPPPEVALLPDSMFFTRSVPVIAGSTPVEAASQIELALEAISPFPLAQLYYGWFWPPGSERAFVFAAYRRRFTTDQTAVWAGAELVLPTFASLFAAEVPPATTIVLGSADGLTAVHWATPPVPDKVVVKTLPPEATEEDRARLRDELLREIGGSKTVIDLAEPPVADLAAHDREIVFRAGDLVSRLPATTGSALDVRDKGELATLRAAQKRDVLLWRVTLGAAAALLLIGLGEVALFGGRAWQQVRMTQLRAQQPLVDKIMHLAEQAIRIEELATKRLLPLEMVTVLVGEDGARKPSDIQFTKVKAEQASGLYTVYIDGITNNTAQVNAYGATLAQLPQVERVDPQIAAMRGNVTTFRLTVVFKPDAVKPVSGTTG
ncbi:MAG: hypothetical protein Q7S40_10365 [Opitutaceae bacterium]|nr:hypothetical protein [Opitutaceae bacterium]